MCYEDCLIYFRIKGIRPNTKKHLSRGAFIVSIALLYMYPINFCVVLQLIVIVVAGRANPCE